MMQRTINKPSS